MHAPLLWRSSVSMTALTRREFALDMFACGTSFKTGDSQGRGFESHSLR